MDPRILAAVFVFASVAFGTLFVILVGELVEGWRQRKELASRLEDVVWERATTTGETGNQLLKQVRERSKGLFLQRTLPWLTDLELFVEQAGGGSLQAFVLAGVGLSIAGGFAAWVLSGSMGLGVIAGIAGVALPYFYLRNKRKRRRRAFEAILPEAIDLMTRAIRAGHPFTAGIRMVADETEEPIAGEFSRLADELRFGLAFEDAMVGLSDRVDLVDVQMLATAILVQREVGGNLAEILDNVATTIRSRLSIRRQLRVITAQGRLSGYILSALPIAVGMGIWLLDPSYMAPLFETSAGLFMVLTTIVMQIVGYLWIRKIIDIEI